MGRENPAQLERIGLSAKAVKVYSGTDVKEETISAFGAKVSAISFDNEEVSNQSTDWLGSA